ncbi:MAG TPA: dTDP-4-dehydrorhamnose reductase [Acidimicrobiales bacterium]|nr:dTDP-4-dehydrorhamnose reductase [Acidimicrobiales bacterium]
MRVLVTGAGGQLGRELLDAFEGHQVLGTTHERLDVGDRDAVLQACSAFAPDVIVHASAWTDVDGCEGDPDHAFRANALGTRHVAEGARLAGARVCYVSSDYVFDGTAGRPYTEWDPPNPVSVYGHSKLGGERELDPGATIVRTSWLCGRHGSNVVKTVLRLAAEHERLAFVDDQHGSPTFADDLARAVRALVVARRPGLFHVTNQGATTWFGLARAVLEIAGLDPERVDPIATEALRPPRPAPRPPYSVLDNAALRLSGLPLLADWHEPLERLVKDLLA